MSEIARRYAEACFDLRMDPKRFADTARFVMGCPSLREALEDPTIDWREKEKTLERLELFGGATQLLSFYQLLVKKGRLTLLPEIAEAFEKIDLEAHNEAVCEMWCVHTPDEARQEKIKTNLCRLHHRDRVRLDIRTDPDLLGGFILKIDGVTYDNSVRGRLRGMALKLQERRII